MLPLRLLAFALFVSLVSLQPVVAQEDHADHLRRQLQNYFLPDGLNVGDTKFMHTQFHEPYQRWLQEVNGEPGVGDTGFRSDLRDGYSRLYSGTPCSCNYGSCRPTQVRITSIRPVPDGESGYEILLDGGWYPVPQSSLYLENDVSQEIWDSLMNGLSPPANGHACAFPASGYPNGMNVECVLTERLRG